MSLKNVFILLKRSIKDNKIYCLDTDSDGLNLLHKISQHKLKSYKFNELRPHLLAENYEFEPYKLNVIFLFEIDLFFGQKRKIFNIILA